jgi:hypothetical protein
MSPWRLGGSAGPGLYTAGSGLKPDTSGVWHVVGAFPTQPDPNWFGGVRGARPAHVFCRGFWGVRRGPKRDVIEDPRAQGPNSRGILGARRGGQNATLTRIRTPEAKSGIVSKPCRNRVETVSKPCRNRPNYAPTMLQLCSNYAPTMLQLCSKPLGPKCDVYDD